MSTLNFPYIRRTAGKPINGIEDVLRDERLLRNLWIDLLLEPALVEKCEKFIDRPPVRKELVKALSWYSSYKWLFGRHPSLERLAHKRGITFNPLSTQDFRKDYRSFLKGIISLLE